MSNVEHVTLKRGEFSAFDRKPGTWAKTDKTKDGAYYVIVYCTHPHAYPAVIQGHEDILKDWHIDEQGVVSPSIWITLKGCDWHVMATLEGWNDAS